MNRVPAIIFCHQVLEGTENIEDHWGIDVVSYECQVSSTAYSFVVLAFYIHAFILM